MVRLFRPFSTFTDTGHFQSRHGFEFYVLSLIHPSPPIVHAFHMLPSITFHLPFPFFPLSRPSPPGSLSLFTLCVKFVAIGQKRALREPDGIFSRLKRAKIVTTAPSTTAKPEVYEPLQLEPSEKIYDDRPKPDPDIPSIVLLYEGFGHFLDITDGREDVPGLAGINVKSLRSKVDTFASKMNEYYGDENMRRDAVLPCVTDIFSARRGIQIPEIHAESMGSVRTDGHNTATHGAGTMVVEFRNKIAGINAIPQVELACYVARLNSTKVDEQLYLGWRIPCLGLTIVGELDIDILISQSFEDLDISRM